MNLALVRRERAAVDLAEANAHLARDVVRLLRGDASVNLAPHMYTADTDGSRHTNGHSSAAYYAKRDEDATFSIAMHNITARHENFLDMGVGGDDAVTHRGLVAARTVGAGFYFGLDLAPGLAHRSAEIADENGLIGRAVTCDIFARIPIIVPNSLIGVLGLTIGNVETFRDPVAFKNRLIGIYRNYAEAVVSPLSNQKAKSSLLVGWDASMNGKEVIACYNNPEMAALVRSLPDRVMDTDQFDYAITAEKVSLGDGQDVLFVSLGLRARVAHTIFCGGESVPIQAGTFLPVINTDRASIPFMVDAFERAHWAPRDRWSASGRVQYQHCEIG